MPIRDRIRTFFTLSAVVACLAALGCGETVLSETTRELEAPEQLKFGRVYVGEQAVQTLAIESVGTGQADVIGVTTDHPDIEIAFAQRTPVDPFDTLSVPVTWRAGDAGQLHDAVITIETDVPDGELLTVIVRGQAELTPSCDDTNPCTDDAFDRVSERCVHLPHDRECDDGSACTVSDSCMAGSCRGVARTCDDGVACTLNLCDPVSGCVFAPNDAACANFDESDPCLAGACHPEQGCIYDAAPDGTACGPSDCATTRVCFGGACHAIDIRQSSNGLPCDDEDPCTAGDACLDGLCYGGDPAPADPAVVVTLPTFGGEGSYVGADGFRYVFADADALKFATPQLDGALAVVSELPIRGTAPPVLIEAGRFLIAAGDALHLIDATDVAAPFVVWSLDGWELGLYGDFSHVLRVNGGVVVANDLWGAATADSDWAGAAEMMEAGPAFLPIVGDTAPGVARALGFAYGLTDLDANDGDVAWLAEGQLTWLRIDAEGGILARAQSNPALSSVTYIFAEAVAVDGNAIVTVGDICLQKDLVIEPTVPECDTLESCEWFSPGSYDPSVPIAAYYQDCSVDPACPAGTTCKWVWARPLDGVTPDIYAQGAYGDVNRQLCVPEEAGIFGPGYCLMIPEARDVLLQEPLALTVGPEGLHATWTDAAGDFYVQTELIDPMAGNRLAIAPFGVNLSGPIALPLEQDGWYLFSTGASDSGMAEPPGPYVSVRRVSGPLHGDVTAVVGDDNGSSRGVLVAGPVATGRVNLDTREVERWQLAETATSERAPRVLRGVERSTAVGERARVPEQLYDVAMVGACTGPNLSIIDHQGAESQQNLCGIYDGSLDVAAEYVWAYATNQPDDINCIPEVRLRAWQLDGGVEPVLDLPVDYWDMWYASALRASDDGAWLTLARSDSMDDGPPRLDVRLFATGPDLSAASHVADLPTTSQQVTRGRVANDGGLIMVGETDGLRLWDLDGMADPVGPSSLAMPLSGYDVPQTLWMRDGRAWVAVDVPSPLAVEPPIVSHRLSQVSYGPGGLELDGGVDLPAPPRRAFDAGDETVITSDRGVTLLRPACL